MNALDSREISHPNPLVPLGASELYSFTLGKLPVLRGVDRGLEPHLPLRSRVVGMGRIVGTGHGDEVALRIYVNDGAVRVGRDAQLVIPLASVADYIPNLIVGGVLRFFVGESLVGQDAGTVGSPESFLLVQIITNEPCQLLAFGLVRSKDDSAIIS